MTAEEDAQEVQSAIFRMVTAFRRQRAEFMAAGSMEAHANAPVAARHLGAAEQIVQGGPTTVGMLASMLSVDVTTASKIATELEAAGIVERNRDPADRRRIVIDVVPRWRERVHSSMEELRAPLVQAISQLTPEELAGFQRGINLYADALDFADMAPHPKPSDDATP